MKPVFTEKDVTYVWIRVNNIYMVSVQKGNPNVAMVLTFLYKVRDVFKSYFKETKFKLDSYFEDHTSNQIFCVK